MHEPFNPELHVRVHKRFAHLQSTHVARIFWYLLTRLSNNPSKESLHQALCLPISKFCDMITYL